MGDLRGIHGYDAIQAFIRAGGVMRQGRGDHVNKMPNGQLITISWSKEIKIGLLKASLRKAGLTEEEFKKLL